MQKKWTQSDASFYREKNSVKSATVPLKIAESMKKAQGGFNLVTQ
jgi:hypothetical protein